MANEQQDLTDEDLLLEKMKDTRTAITEKLEQLEHKVVDTTVKAVSESVGTVLDTTQAVKDTVDSVKESVQQTVGSVKEFAQQGVETLKETLDLRRHTQRHPWVVLGGAVAVGYCLEKWLFDHGPAASKTALPPPSAGQPAKAHGTHRNGGYRDRRESKLASATKSWLAGLFDRFGPELDQFKRMALGVTLSLVRDVVARAVPPDWFPQVTDTFNRLAQRMNVEITDFTGPQPAHAAAAYPAGPGVSPAAETARPAQWPERNLGRFERQ